MWLMKECDPTVNPLVWITPEIGSNSILYADIDMKGI